MSEPIHIISLGAGVQSSTMALMAAKGEITPMPKCAIFADTQDEPMSVYDWLDWLEGRLPFPVHRVTKGSLSSSALKTSGSITAIPVFTISSNGQHGKIPMRSCTSDFKIGPIRKAVRSIARINRGESMVRVVQWIGISVDEVSRMKDSREPWQENRWPLVERRMNRNDCLRWMDENKFPKPPRSACIYCPFHSDSEWLRLKSQEPGEFRKAVEFEIALQNAKKNLKSKSFRDVPYLHSSRKPLAEVDFSTEEERGQLNMFNNECEGMCGV